MYGHFSRLIYALTFGKLHWFRGVLFIRGLITQRHWDSSFEIEQRIKVQGSMNNFSFTLNSETFNFSFHAFFNI